METTTQTQRYYVPAPSWWPLVGSVALLLMAVGFVIMLQKNATGSYVMIAGALILIAMLFGWFGTVIRESVGGLFNDQVDVSYRWGMGWFIFSEVMFFGALFFALFYARIFSVPELGDTDLLWPNYEGTWPTDGPGV